MSDSIDVLLLTDAAVDFRTVGGLGIGARVVAVALAPGAEAGLGDLPWSVKAAGELLDVDRLRCEFLDFVQQWPERDIGREGSFGKCFRTRDGYSLWWLGPGCQRNPDHEPFLTMRDIWLTRQAIDRWRPGRLLVFTSRPELAEAVQSLCRQRSISCQFLPGSKRPTRPPWSGQARWFAGSLLWLIVHPLMVLFRSIAARLRTGRRQVGDPARPAVVATAAFPRSVRGSGGGLEVWFWSEFREALARADAKVRCLFMLRSKWQGVRSAWLGNSRWGDLAGCEGLVPIPERHAAVRAFVRAAGRQLAAMWRYAKWERSGQFRNSFRFAGADVSALYVPRLRRSVARLAGWERSVAAAEASLRSAGRVNALLVTEEFYEPGMIDIAAARRAGVPSVGVQHGTIFPMHLIYTLPPGQVRDAPVPDYFAAYGQFAGEVVSRWGAFPADYVWICGSARFDALVADPPDQGAARARLKLPADKRIILLATQNYPWFPRAAEALLKSVRGREDVVLCIKTHPNDVPLGAYRELASAVGAGNVRFYDGSFDELVAACDILVSGSSTTILEANLLGRCAICVNFSGEPDRYPYVANGGAVAARSAEEMSEAIDQCLDPARQGELRQRREAFLARHAGPSARGEGADTLANFVLTLIDSSDSSQG